VSTIPTDFTESASVTGERVTLTVGTYSPDRGQRRSWHYYVTLTDGTIAHEGDDLSGYGDATENLRALASFAAAWAESLDYAQRNGIAVDDTESGTMFPASLADTLGYEAEWLACEVDAPTSYHP